MDSVESLEEFYKRKFELLPENLGKDIGHFNIFQIAPFREGKARSVPYRRRDFYKIMLLQGNSQVYFADKVYEIKKQALAFSNPLIPYKWEQLDKMYDGVFCIFNAQFFHQNTSFTDYEIFQPGGNHIFELTDRQFAEIQEIFEAMEAEFNSGYKYKFDVIRNRISDLIHYGLKLEPSTSLFNHSVDAAYRISRLFMELLERQFPIDDSHLSIDLRSPSEFAEHLNVHVNSLNRAVKSTTSKTTSEVIADRILQESKVLLKHTTWSISEIAFALGFKEVTHFSNFFKKHMELNASKFRNAG
ncbi:helix-turn-helix domain-containing protein [Flavilitoribacter nigricans]|uniref:AraC family transcriptional regulator n=1 Tax=Flavilitoribacter nigricans (strain ATCC 23147 / DSM 23189 / NBRC 102662 / NCIMB 1420 / SS-2) TaxID=1122177 RepID=A0A2D0NEN8_FLAN2|nr:AraC family transcriptional regulator [Flavilitoribacter nigricans DSM 23189 = NBRC 102662]